LFFVENMEHTRKCGMIRLDDITDGSRSVCENRDNKAGILIAASLPHPIPDLEFCRHPLSIAGRSGRRERTSSALFFKLRHYREIGNFAFSVEFKSFAEYGKCVDALKADPAFQAWRAKNQESGVAEWVRSNLLRELTH
jgi:hypothetical protein